MTTISWHGWTADYTDAERALMPKDPKHVEEAKFIHELKARIPGVLMDGRDHFPIPERALLELNLMEDVA